MIQTYDKKQPGTVKVFFSVEDGAVSSVTVGNQAVTKEKGFQFYVDDYVADQIRKCELRLDGLSPTLVLREGEELEVPQKTEKELEIERLKYELEKLQNEEENAE